jgi:hypothetical protein
MRTDSSTRISGTGPLTAGAAPTYGIRSQAGPEVEEVTDVLSARTNSYTDAEQRLFQPTLIDDPRPAIDTVALMAMAVMFEGYDEPAAIIEPELSPSIWDDALDVRLACL